MMAWLTLSMIATQVIDLSEIALPSGSILAVIGVVSLYFQMKNGQETMLKNLEELAKANESLAKANEKANETFAAEIQALKTWRQEVIVRAETIEKITGRQDSSPIDLPP